MVIDRARATALAVAGVLLSAWGCPNQSLAEPPPSVSGPRLGAGTEEPIPSRPLLPLAVEACRDGVDVGGGLDPLLRTMLDSAHHTAWKRLVKAGAKGGLRWLFIPAAHCIGTQLVDRSGITLVFMHTFDLDVDDTAWTAYYYKALLSGEVVATIYGIHAGNQRQFMNIGVNDDRIQAEWEREKAFWLSRLP